MIFFSKPKILLRDLIPDNFTDIHSHLMPGIDDGAKKIEDTFTLIEELQRMNFKNFIVTPHTFSGVWDNTKEGILDKEKETNAQLIEKNCSLKAASEYLLDDHFINLCKNNEILTLKDKYVLVEMSYLNPPIHLYDLLFDLQVAGYKPVLAHPERYIFYHNNFEEYKKLKNAGCLLQLNLLSTVGYYGNEVTETAKKLLGKGLIDFVGSDVHHKKHVEAFNQKIKLKDSLPLKEAIGNNQFFT